MISALISFFGGSVFRMIWGEVSAFITAKQEHAQELDRMRLQGELDAAAHARNQEAIKTQAALGVKIIEVQRDADIDRIEAGAWSTLVESTTKTIGIAFIDVWNAGIRPGVATWAIVMMTASEFSLIVLSEFAASVACAALGIYLADRNLSKRGK